MLGEKRWSANPHLVSLVKEVFENVERVILNGAFCYYEIKLDNPELYDFYSSRIETAAFFDYTFGGIAQN